VAAHVAARYLERLRRDVDGIYPRPGQHAGACDRDAARTRTYIEHPPHSPRVDPRHEAPLDQLGNGRARNENAAIDLDARTREPGDAGEIGGRNALADAACEEPLHALHTGAAYTAPIERATPRVWQPESVQYQRCGLIACIVGAVTEEHACAPEPRRAARDQHANRERAPTARAVGRQAAAALCGAAASCGAAALPAALAQRAAPSTPAVRTRMK